MRTDAGETFTDIVEEIDTRTSREKNLGFEVTQWKPIMISFAFPWARGWSVSCCLAASFEIFGQYFYNGN